MSSTKMPGWSVIFQSDDIERSESSELFINHDMQLIIFIIHGCSTAML
jgi:hypothetical protein